MCEGFNFSREFSWKLSHYISGSKSPVPLDPRLGLIKIYSEKNIINIKINIGFKESGSFN